MICHMGRLCPDSSDSLTASTCGRMDRAWLKVLKVEPAGLNGGPGHPCASLASSWPVPAPRNLPISPLRRPDSASFIALVFPTSPDTSPRCAGGLSLFRPQRSPRPCRSEQHALATDSSCVLVSHNILLIPSQLCHFIPLTFPLSSAEPREPPILAKASHPLDTLLTSTLAALPHWSPRAVAIGDLFWAVVPLRQSFASLHLDSLSDAAVFALLLLSIDTSMLSQYYSISLPFSKSKLFSMNCSHIVSGVQSLAPASTSHFPPSKPRSRSPLVPRAPAGTPVPIQK